jgi:hypothetical protein
MNASIACDEDLVRRLPLPVAQLYRRAANARTALDRYLTSFYLWEASLKLTAGVAIVLYSRQPVSEAKITEKLQNLARPALGHWWEFVRLLVPALAEQNDEPFRRRARRIANREPTVEERRNFLNR